jgi:hypothetical protein
MLKVFFWTAVAVFGGIYAWSLLTKKLPKSAGNQTTTVQTPGGYDPQGQIIFQGPDIDPSSGAYLQPGAKPGTVGFGAEKM